MNIKQVRIDGKLFELGRRIGKGGEGEVYSLQNDTSLAVKIYTTTDKLSREAKIASMVQLSLSKKTTLVAFPISLARSKDGGFIGFVMKLVSDHKPLHELYSPGPRKIHFPQADYRFLVRTANNIAKAVASVHQAGCVIGDINHSSMLISPKAMVALIDADSFQITSSTERYLCKVGVPEYTPPELQGLNLGQVTRTQNHDAFGLAIVIFQLLFMGRHPFVGTVRKGEIPPLHENIKNYKYVYTDSCDVGMDQPPGTPDILDFSPLLASAFDKAFLKQHSAQRPTAQDWIHILDRLEASLVKCDENQLHFIPKEASECAWCEMENILPITLFVPFIAGASKVEGRDPGALVFNLDAVWIKIEPLITPIQFQPKLSSLNPAPSKQAEEAKKSVNKFNFGIVISIAAVIAFFNFPQFFWIWLIVGLIGYVSFNEKKSVDARPFLTAYEEATKRWGYELANWNQRVGIDAFTKLRSELIDARNAYVNLIAEEKTLLQNYRNERRNKQLHAFLDTFYISKALIKGIGPGRLATLASYGIDTAADINKSRLLGLPGFGQAIAGPLLVWRENLEKRFVYQANENENDRIEQARIKSSIEAKLSPIRQKLSAGEVNLKNLRHKITLAANIEDPTLNQINLKRAQAKVDLEYLEIRVPVISVPSPHTQQSTSGTKVVPAPKQTNPSRTTSTVVCPRCGSKMVQRFARRGRNAGRPFWGCSRYPTCKGTRSI
jgi:DNA-binding helix-hairpin-helix protein with protein kinase domain